MAITLLSKPQPVGVKATLHPCLLTQKVKKLVTRRQPPIYTLIPKVHASRFPRAVLEASCGNAASHLQCSDFVKVTARANVLTKTSGGFVLKQPGLGTQAGPAEGCFHLSATDDGNIEAMDCVSASSSLHTS